MGYTTYSLASAATTRTANNYYTKSANEIFTQNIKQEVHQGLDPKGVLVRECLDSVEHPASFPIILSLDVTGSMGAIPHDLIKDGLPTLMGKIIQKTPDAALLFLAVGDASCDKCPLQVAQFESGDEELDGWLTKTYIEGGGGGNAGESYPLAWYFAAHHTKTDAFDKRNQKGLLFTVGDEPCIELTKNQIQHIMGNSHQTGYTPAEILEGAKEKYDVYHLHVMQGSAGKRSLAYWQQLLGDHCIKVSDYTKIPEVMADIVVKNIKSTTGTVSHAPHYDPTEVIL